MMNRPMNDNLKGDSRERVVTLPVLQALCAKASGVCHRYEVTKVGENRVSVTYSNPDEWAQDHPMAAVFPAFYDSAFGGQVYVVLHAVRIINDTWDSEGWQAFSFLNE